MDATVIDLAPLLDPLVRLGALVVAGLLTRVAVRAVTVARDKFHLQVSQQQVQALHDAADTGAGVIYTMLARGEVQVHDVHIANPLVRTAAQTALNAVIQSADAQQVTVPGMAQIILGRLGPMIAADPTVSLPVPQPKAA